jgi:23S rRNA G2445 N2-methylase RlmL
MSGAALSVFALATRGLEDVAAEEMAALPQVQVLGMGYRRVSASAAAEEALSGLLGLRTVDDVFLDLGTWSGVGRHRSALDLLARRAAALPLAGAARAVRRVRELPRCPSFAVTASFVGRRNYRSGEIAVRVGESVAKALGWPYRERDSSAYLNLRLFIEHEIAHAGLRIGATPLHRRAYKVAHIPGSLKPTVAAALLRLAGVGPGATILDPCCGAGTILVEASLAGVQAVGGDLDPQAVNACVANAGQAHIRARVSRWDAVELPMRDGSVDTLVTNLPWGREVGLSTSVPVLYRRILAEAERALGGSGRAVILSDSAEHVQVPSLPSRREIEISLFGRTPTVVVLSAQGPSRGPARSV